MFSTLVAGRFPTSSRTSSTWRWTEIKGLLQLVHHTSYLLEQLGPGDRVAVLVHDTQLRLRLDFTSSRGALERALSHSGLNEWPAPPPPGPSPSLASHIDPFDAREADTPEEALLVLARALEALPLPRWPAGGHLQGP